MLSRPLGSDVVAAAVLIGGGVFGLNPVPTTQWSGLPALLHPLGGRPCPRLSARCRARFGALFEAAGDPRHRRSSSSRSIRGVPLISILFMASVMLPLFMPSGVTVDKLLRAQIAIIIFAAAYIAEAVRGGLQAIPRGQHEAASRDGTALLAGDAPHRAAAGTEDRHPAAGEHLDRLLPGYDARHDHRPAGLPVDGPHRDARIRTGSASP